jgi:hypothetical protein
LFLRNRTRRLELYPNRCRRRQAAAENEIYRRRLPPKDAEKRIYPRLSPPRAIAAAA